MRQRGRVVARLVTASALASALAAAGAVALAASRAPAAAVPAVRGPRAGARLPGRPGRRTRRPGGPPRVDGRALGPGRAAQGPDRRGARRERRGRRCDYCWVQRAGRRRDRSRPARRRRLRAGWPLMPADRRSRWPRWALLAPTAAAAFSATVAWATSHDPSARSASTVTATAGQNGPSTTPTVPAPQLQQALDGQTAALQRLSATVRSLEAQLRSARRERANRGTSPTTSGAPSAGRPGAAASAPSTAQAAPAVARPTSAPAPVVRAAPSPAPPPPVHTTTGGSRP